MTYTRLMLISVIWAFPVLAALGQTVFPEKPRSLGMVPTSSRLLYEADSRQRITAARSLLRDGKLWDAATILANADGTVDLDNGIEPDLAHLSRAILELHKGNLRVADREALAVTDFGVQGDALVLRSLIYAKAGVWCISQQLLEQAKSWDPLHTAHDRQPAIIKYTQELLTARAGPPAPPPHDEPAPWERLRGKHAGFYYVIDRQAEASGRSVVTVWKSGNSPEFRAAISLEPQDRPGQPQTWSMYLCDLEGPPLRLAERLKARPSDQEFLAFVQSFDPSFGNDIPAGRYTLMRAELEALAAYQLGIAPLAMRWADYARTALVQDQVIKPLQEQRASKWTLRETSKFGPWYPCGYQMSGYINDDLTAVDSHEVARAELVKQRGIATAEIDDLMKGPLEHYYFVICTRKTNLYCGSFAVASDEVEPGDRVYFLKRIIQGRATVAATYPTLPTFESVVAEIRQFLQEAPAAPLTLSGRASARIEDQLDPSDEKEEAKFQRGLRKTYRVSLTGGTQYFIDLSSPDFDAALRIEDEQGQDFRDIEHTLFLQYVDRLLGKEGTREGRYNSRVLFQAPRDGTYWIVASTFEKDKGGRFVLTIREQQRPR